MRTPQAPRTALRTPFPAAFRACLAVALAASVCLSGAFAARVIPEAKLNARDRAGYRYAVPELPEVERRLGELDAEDVRERLERERAEADKPGNGRGQGADKGAAKPKNAGLVQASNPVQVRRALNRIDTGGPYHVEFEGPGLLRLKLPRHSREPGQGGPPSKVSFYSFSLRPAVAADGEAVSTLGVAGVVVGFRYEKALGPTRFLSLIAANGDVSEMGDGDWIDTGVRFPLDETFQAQMPMEFTLRVDREAGEWDLFFMNRLQLGGLFVSGKDEGVWILSEGEGATEVSHLLLGDDNPLFTDEDRDGIEDGFEEELGFSTEADDRRQRDELGEYTALQHFMNARRRYRSPAQKELEEVLNEATILDELGESDEPIAHLKISDELRRGKPTLEELQRDVESQAASMRELMQRMRDAPKLPQGDAVEELLEDPVEDPVEDRVEEGGQG